MNKLYISIKNLVIALIVIALVVGIAELILVFGKLKNSKLYSENFNLTLLQLEAYPLDELFYVRNKCIQLAVG